MKTNLPNVPHFRSPWVVFYGHVHTIARSLTGDTNPPKMDRIEIPIPDDDFLELDCAIQSDSETVIIYLPFWIFHL